MTQAVNKHIDSQHNHDAKDTIDSFKVTDTDIFNAKGSVLVVSNPLSNAELTESSLSIANISPSSKRRNIASVATSTHTKL